MAQFDVSRLEALPPLTLEEASWLTGMTPEAMSMFLESGGMRPVVVEKKGVPLLELLRIGFRLLSQKETQLEMMRILVERDPVMVTSIGKPPVKQMTVSSKGSDGGKAKGGKAKEGKKKK